LGCQVLQVLREVQVAVDHREALDLQDHQDLLGLVVDLVLKDHLDLSDQLVQQELQEHQALKVHLA